MLTGQLLMPVAHITDYSMQKWPPQHHSCPLGTWQHLQIAVYAPLVGYIQGPPGCLLQPQGWRPKVEPIRVSSHETDLWRFLHRLNLSRLQYHACGDFPNIWPPVRIFKSAECPLLSVFHGGGIVDFAADCWVISNYCGFCSLFFFFFFAKSTMANLHQNLQNLDGLFLQIHCRNVSVANPTPCEITLTLSSCLLNIIRQVEA